MNQSPLEHIYGRIIKPEELASFRAKFNPPEFTPVKNWIGIVSIYSIEYYKSRMLDMVQKPEFLKSVLDNGRRYASMIHFLNCWKIQSLVNMNSL